LGILRHLGILAIAILTPDSLDKVLEIQADLLRGNIVRPSEGDEL